MLAHLSCLTPAPDTSSPDLDDDVVQFTVRPFLCTARRLQLDVASPAIMGEATRPSWGLMQRREYAGAARIVTIVEIHVTYFSPRAWACYQELLDPILNWGGYGYDIWLQNYMVDHCALREPKMGILDGYSATHAHHWFRKDAHVAQKLWLAARAHNGSRVYQMLDMDKAMRQRGTPVRHACTHRQASTCEPDSLSSTKSPSNESILQHAAQVVLGQGRCPGTVSRSAGGRLRIGGWIGSRRKLRPTRARQRV